VDLDTSRTLSNVSAQRKKDYKYDFSTGRNIYIALKTAAAGLLGR
jgi:hypothetical protein